VSRVRLRVYWSVRSTWRHEKHSLIYCYVLDRVYRAVAWQCVDQIRYNTFYEVTNVQDVPVGKVNILGRHSVGHCKQESVHVQLSYSEEIPRYNCGCYLLYK
jgi:hypothetical protein